MKMHLDKSEWAEHAFEEGHKIESCFDLYCFDDENNNNTINDKEKNTVSHN